MNHLRPCLALIALALVTLLAAATPMLCAVAPAAPTRLRCEYLTNPMGIDSLQPRFFWVVQDSRRGEMQSAYQIIVATSADALGRDLGDQWDSGRVESPDSIQVVYQGKTLESGDDYYWKVRTWDKEGNAGPYSAPAHFGMGLLARAEWKGSWIGGGSADGNEFRKEITLPGKVVRARAYITALGYYELRLNGEKVGHYVLDPGWTTYAKRVLYTTYDITHRLKPGANALGVILGGGWATLKVPNLTPFYQSPAFLLQVNIELEGGKSMSLASDGSWNTTRGPIQSDSVYNGEIYDARRETPGWDSAGFNDSSWAAAQVVEGSQGERSAQAMPAIRVVDSIVPVKLTSPQPGVYVYDLGQNISGWARLEVRGPAGSAVTMRFSELLYSDGMINQDNLRTAKARDIYILKGEGLETYEPRFTYHGFRYIEVTGFPGSPSLDSIRGQLVHTAVNTVGSFTASKQILNDLQKTVRWSQLTNLFSVPTDCDQRDERQGWMGDAQVTAEEAMLNFDMAAFYANFVRDMRDAQREDGAMPSTVPKRWGDLPADLGWETAYPLIAWYMWQQYGDRRILEENATSLKKYTEFLRSLAEDNVLAKYPGHEGDWVETQHTPNEIIADAWYYYDVTIFARMEQVLGHTAEADTYFQLARDIGEAFNRTFLDPKTHQYANGSQASNAFALFLHLEPKEVHNQVVTNLTHDILYFHNTHTTTGFIGVKVLMPALTMVGRSDLAYELAVQTTYPSWGYMLANGATTFWELWENKVGPSMNSEDHAMFSSVGAWYYQALGGINQQPDTAGYRHVLIAPQIVEDLRWANASVETIRGTVSSSWTHARTGDTLSVSVPAGADAKIVLPLPRPQTNPTIKEGDRVVWQEGHYVPGDPGITSAKEENGNFVFEAGSGDYAFTLIGQ